eukprot:TRINITY_DN88488_c0_g1_i1.p1 TRINITY_DN88488_c0_g1~~TRINITY_DN88488_c0_g1_i1.p1  ORF type:complete len:118 (-),score=8.71 TRINITY_DN88488_c0_g1_i1:17-343(-)
MSLATSETFRACQLLFLILVVAFWLAQHWSPPELSFAGLDRALYDLSRRKAWAKLGFAQVFLPFSRSFSTVMAAAAAGGLFGITTGKRVFVQYVGCDLWHERIALSHV